MNVMYEPPQSTLTVFAGRRNVWAAVAIGAIIVGLIVLLAIRLTHAVAVKPAVNKKPFRRCRLPKSG